MFRVIDEKKACPSVVAGLPGWCAS